MSDFKAKMYQIQFRPLGELTALPRPPSWIKEAYFEGEGGAETGRGEDGRGLGHRKGRGGGVEGTRPNPFTPPNPYFWIRPWLGSVLGNICGKDE